MVDPLGGIIVTVILAILTYLIVEPQLRFGRYGKYKAIVLLFSMLAIGSCGLFIYKIDGFPWRFSTHQLSGDTSWLKR